MVSVPEENDKKPYQPDLNRAHPFKWINFPVFLGIWFILFWFVLCPILWTKMSNWTKTNSHSWPSIWPYYFWIAAFVIFLMILVIIIVIWKCEGIKRKLAYNSVFLNPQTGDEKEKLCIHCMKFHPPGKYFCPSSVQFNKCDKCGNSKESFNNCCRRVSEPKAPIYDVVLEKQQPKGDIVFRERKDELDSKEIKRNSAKSGKKRHSSSSTRSMVLITTHEVGMKNLINKSRDNNENSDQSIKLKKVTKLKPINVDLANKYDDETCTSIKLDDHLVADSKTTSPVRSLESDTPGTPYKMKKNFNEFLHLVEINTPFTPESAQEIVKTPLSPREIFFYDLIQAVEQSDNCSPDSLHFGGYEKKRPTSHILVSSEINYDNEADKTKLEELSLNTIDKNQHSQITTAQNIITRVVSASYKDKQLTTEHDNEENGCKNEERLEYSKL